MPHQRLKQRPRPRVPQRVQAHKQRPQPRARPHHPRHRPAVRDPIDRQVQILQVRPPLLQPPRQPLHPRVLQARVEQVQHTQALVPGSQAPEMHRARLHGVHFEPQRCHLGRGREGFCHRGAEVRCDTVAGDVPGGDMGVGGHEAGESVEALGDFGGVPLEDHVVAHEEMLHPGVGVGAEGIAELNEPGPHDLLAQVHSPVREQDTTLQPPRVLGGSAAQLTEEPVKHRPVWDVHRQGRGLRYELLWKGTDFWAGVRALLLQFSVLHHLPHPTKQTVEHRPAVVLGPRADCSCYLQCHLRIPPGLGDADAQIRDVLPPVEFFNVCRQRKDQIVDGLLRCALGPVEALGMEHGEHGELPHVPAAQEGRLTSHHFPEVVEVNGGEAHIYAVGQGKSGGYLTHGASQLLRGVSQMLIGCHNRVGLKSDTLPLADSGNRGADACVHFILHHVRPEVTLGEQLLQELG
mmetsp:Transcript_112652/g.258059  ORF Transcript_112652/g.258059 Transcript_112652/m.258059 type:complete len:463 (+) Transcript_112652:470-1858(+)